MGTLAGTGRLRLAGGHGAAAAGPRECDGSNATVHSNSRRNQCPRRYATVVGGRSDVDLLLLKADCGAECIEITAVGIG